MDASVSPSLMPAKCARPWVLIHDTWILLPPPPTHEMSLQGRSPLLYVTMLALAPLRFLRSSHASSGASSGHGPGGPMHSVQTRAQGPGQTSCRGGGGSFVGVGAADPRCRRPSMASSRRLPLGVSPPPHQPGEAALGCASGSCKGRSASRCAKSALVAIIGGAPPGGSPSKVGWPAQRDEGSDGGIPCRCSDGWAVWAASAAAAMEVAGAERLMTLAAASSSSGVASSAASSNIKPGSA
mmetsp:Transcript_80282/g.225660  ORF Transcript_80282/g.225660 Transcript_80282/m.225660 type:complete len:240 (+) Transcript_80282:739-1458(+)